MTSKNSININDSIDISFYNVVEQELDNSFFLTYPEFKNLTIKSKKYSKQEFVELIESIINPRIFKNIIKNTILNDKKYQYVVDTIVYKKYFSEFLPQIPLIRILDNETSRPNTCVFINNIPIGIQMDKNHILPFIVLFQLLKTLVINDGVFIFDYINYDIMETHNETNDEVHYFLVLNESIKFNTIDKQYKLSSGDIIFNINGNNFNKNGKIYSDKLDLFLPLNLYLMLTGHNRITIDFMPQSKIIKTKENIDFKLIGKTSKSIDIILPLFNQNRLRIPLFPEKTFNFKNLEFSILNEKLMEEHTDCPLNKRHFEKNTYSSHKYIVLTNHESGKLYVLKKISNKKMKTFEEMVDYITNIPEKNKKTFYFERTNDLLQITV
jgi:hypothetical protein